ncbi:NAD(P)/FAD-dependent oxidoreductase, partial [bacterium]|nr:NAD(P)/FAD-dependent oxidoreductase [bacterium]
MKYDVVVIGAGHNGLTAAAYLAGAGRKVLVAEKNDFVGGLAAGAEFCPGYSHAGTLIETGGISPQVIRELELGSYGLQYRPQVNTTWLLGEDGKAVKISADDEETAKSISAFSQHDADNYTRYRMLVETVRPFVSKLRDNPQPDLFADSIGGKVGIATLGLALRKMGKSNVRELLKVMPMSVKDYLDELFETEFLKAGLCLPTLGSSFTAPRSAYTTLSLIFHEATRSGSLAGGPAKLVSALEACARNRGVEIRTGSEVTEIVLGDGTNVSGVTLSSGEVIEARVVVATCSPKELFLNLMAGRDVG